MNAMVLPQPAESQPSGRGGIRLAVAITLTAWLLLVVSLGVAGARMEAVGYGETRPKVPDNSPANQAINRRVDFVVLQ